MLLLLCFFDTLLSFNYVIWQILQRFLRLRTIVGSHRISSKVGKGKLLPPELSLSGRSQYLAHVGIIILNLLFRAHHHGHLLLRPRSLLLLYNMLPVVFLNFAVNVSIEAINQPLLLILLLLLLLLLALKAFTLQLLLLLKSELLSELGLAQSFLVQSGHHPVIIPHRPLHLLRACVHEVIIDDLDELLEATIDLLGRDSAHFGLVQQQPVSVLPLEDGEV